MTLFPARLVKGGLVQYDLTTGKVLKTIPLQYNPDTLTRTLQVLFGTSASNGQLRMNFTNKVLVGDTTPGFTIDLAHKDLSLIVDAANAERVPVPIAAVAREAFSSARSQGHGGKDFSAVVDVLCENAGIKKPRLK